MSVDDGDVFKSSATAGQKLLLQLEFLAQAGSASVLTPATENGAPSRRTATASAVADTVMQLIVQQQHEEQIRLINERLDRMDEASVRALQDIEDELAEVRRERTKMREQAYHDEQGRAIFMKADASAAFYEDGTQLDDETFGAVKDRLTGKPTWDDLQNNFGKENDLLTAADQIHAHDATRNQIREDLAAGRISDEEAVNRLREAETTAPERLHANLTPSGAQPPTAAEFSDDEFAQASTRTALDTPAWNPKPLTL
ncbi:MAG: hypothetical protein J0H94_09110 [Rhizobiales bacterium]|nr:hypothetical protein [Hyphomicrobiales bacterium]